MQDVRSNRNEFIGGSDIPVIMGISPFKTRFELLLEKAGLQENDFDGNEYTEFGNILEPQIRDYINELWQLDFKEDKLIIGDVRCHLDGFNGDSVLEIKTTSQIKEKTSDYKNYLVQLLFYMYNYNVKNGFLAIYERPEDFNQVFDESRLTIHKVDLYDYKELLNEVLDAVDSFRKDLVKVKENPFITEEELQPYDVVVLSNRVLQLEKQLASYKELQETYEALKQELIKAMEENNIKKWTTNNGVKITLVEKVDPKTEIVKKFDEKAFKESNEDLFNKYLIDVEKTTNGRKASLRITLPKEEK